MKQENEPNDELQQLLDALEEHGQNARRQQRLGELIDSMEASEGSLRGGTLKRSSPDNAGLLRPARNDAKRRKHYPIWWAMGAAAACLLLWLIVKPTDNHPKNEKEALIAEDVVAKDSVVAESEEIVHVQEPYTIQEPIAEKQAAKATKPKAKKTKQVETNNTRAEEIPILVEVVQTETVDTEKTGSIAPINEMPNEPLALESQTPKRRVIKSESLVGYGKMDRQTEKKPTKLPILEDRTIFGQPQDPNMKNGMLAMEIKF